MKKFLVVLAAVAMAGLSQASELWWTVSNPTVDDETAGTWDTAKLYANTTDSNVRGTLIDQISAEDLSFLGGTKSELGGYADSAYSFYLEIFNGDQLVGASVVGQVASYDSLVTAGAIRSGDVMGGGTASPYAYSSFTTNVIPEPTSGLMILLGLAALGLKRKYA